MYYIRMVTAEVLLVFSGRVKAFCFSKNPLSDEKVPFSAYFAEA